MLTYVELIITAYLILKILRSRRGADAAGYLLVSALMPLPLYVVGRSVDAGMFPIDVCLLAYLLAHGLSVFDYVVRHRIPASIMALFALTVLVTWSGVFNFLFIDAGPIRFYAFTVVKFWEYALVAIVLMASKPDAAQLRKMCLIMVSGILVYEIVHALHITGIVPLSGENYFGIRAEDNDLGNAPFTDRTQWFLTTSRVVVGGTASISAWFSLMVFETYQGTIKVAAAMAAILSVFSIFATSSRSDIAGLVAAAIVFSLYAPRRQWKAYVLAAFMVAVLYGAYLTLLLPKGEQSSEMTRLTELWSPELRAQGNYAVRSSDRASLSSYLVEHPRELLIGVGPGNFRWYRDQRITENFFGHNSYLHWTGELGIGGFLLLLAWCLSICLYALKRIKSQDRVRRLAARTCLALVVGRMVAAWGAESLFGTEGMGQYSMFFVGVAYLLISVASNVDARGFRVRLRPDTVEKINRREAATICPS